jgi:acyl-coenzyme A synthetase/AMP-(fatty) acid ligase
MNSNVLSRYHINPEIELRHQDIYGNIETLNYSDLCKMIDHWKYMLVEKYGAGPGKTVMIEFNFTNFYYFSAIYAAWELGLTLIVDWPHAYTEKSCYSKIFSIHGKIDYAIVYSHQIDPADDQGYYSEWDTLRTRLHCKEIITEKDFDHYKILDRARYKEVATTVYATPTTQAIWTATSGSTGIPKQQRIDHNSVVLQAQRLCKHLNFQSGTSSLHTNNLHHGASACYHFLPSMMMAKEHWILNSNFATEAESKNLTDHIIDKKINKLFLYTPSKLTAWLRTTPVLQHHVDVTTLYYCPKDMIALAKEKNVSSIKSVFGDTTIGYGFLIKDVDLSLPLDDYEPNCIGPKLDDFFEFNLEDQSLYVRIPRIDSTEWKTSHDKFELRDGKYYFLGRGTAYRINDEWIRHQEIESKVSELFDLNNEEGATIVVDNEEQQVYLAIWIDHPDAEAELDSWFSKRFRSVYISKRAKNLNKKDFMGARKVSRPALREYFRTSVPRLVNRIENPWSLS